MSATDPLRPRPAHFPAGRSARGETDLGLYTDTALRAARTVIGRYSTSFSWACRSLPPTLRRDIAAVYAMVRVADEVVDGTARAAGADDTRVRHALDAYELACEEAMATGFATDLVLHAFADVARRHGITPELTRPFTPPPSFMNHMVDATRRFATATLALADVKETAKTLGVTINDMVLAISAGALRQLSLRYDGAADHPLLASVPVSFDFSPDRVSGNYFSGVMMVVPIQLADPLERVRAVHEAAREAKETHHLMGPELVSRWSSYFPPAPMEALFRWLATKDGQNKVLNLPISNVPGPREPGRVGGALVTEIYSVGPLTTGSGLNITVWSYVDQLNVSVLSDGSTLEDPHELTDAMVDAFVEIRAAAGLSTELTVIESAMAP